MDKTIIKKDFIDIVYNKIKEQGHFVPKELVYWTNKAFIDCMLDVLKNGDELNIHQTFILKSKYVKEKKYNNFGREKIIVPEHYEPYFRPLSQMKKACKELEEEKKDA